MDAVRAHNERGIRLFNKGEFANAALAFTDALFVNQSVPQVWSNRSAARMFMEEYALALQDARICVDLDPTWPRGHNRLGAALYHLSDHFGALEAFERAQRLDENNEVAIRGKQKILAQLEAEQESAPKPPPFPDLSEIFGSDTGLPDISNFLTGSTSSDKEMMNALHTIMNNPAMMELAKNLASDPVVQKIMSEGPERMLASVNKMWHANHERDSRRRNEWVEQIE